MGVIKENKEQLDNYLRTNDETYVDEILMNSVEIMFNSIKYVLRKNEIDEEKAEEYFGEVYLNVRERLINKKDYSSDDFGFYCLFTHWVKKSVEHQIKKDGELMNNVVFLEDLTSKEINDYSLIEYFEELNFRKLSDKDKRIIKNVYEDLSDNQKEILNMYFGFNGHERMYLSDIAKKMNKTSEAVSLSFCNALRRFRKSLFDGDKKTNVSKKK